MTAMEVVAFTSCLNDTAVSACVWDVHTGTTLMTYRGDLPVAPAGLSLLSGQYVVAALQDKPFLRVWPVNSQQPLSAPRMVCAGRVTHAEADPAGCYIAVTVAEKLHVYQVASGRLVGTGVRHFQPIRVLRWTVDGSLVVCGGEDGLVTVWLLASLATSQTAPEPRHVLADHSLPVTDLRLTVGSRPRLLTVSADRTCKVYDLAQGTLLVSLVFDQMLTAVTTPPLETDVFLGTDSGAILQMGLLSPPRQLEYHVTAAESAPVFTGHSKAVRCLSTSLSGDLLMSGSSDGSVKVWHISSRQCLRTMTLKGPVTNAFFAPKPKQMFDNELKPSLVLNNFQTASSNEIDCVEVITGQSLTLCDSSIRGLFPTQATECSEERLKSLQLEIDLLRSINSNLYKFSVDKIIADSTGLPSISEVKKELVKQGKKNTKTLVNHNPPVPGNGLSRKKKKKRKKVNKTKVKLNN